MELRFVTPELDPLDRAATEVLLAATFVDERPPRGVAGLFDFRAAARLSRLMLSGFVTSELGEVFMMPALPCMPFDKLILFGAGHSAELDDGVFCGLVERMLGTVEGLRARTVVAELPGRHLDLIAPERAADVLLTAAGDKPEHDVWTLVENLPAQKAINDHWLKKRRRR